MGEAGEAEVEGWGVCEVEVGSGEWTREAVDGDGGEEAGDCVQ